MSGVDDARRMLESMLDAERERHASSTEKCEKCGAMFCRECGFGTGLCDPCTKDLILGDEIAELCPLYKA